MKMDSLIMNIDRLIVRYFTKKIENVGSVFDLFKWKKTDVVIKDYSTGKIIISMQNLEFPENYSQNACDIIATKYFRKKSVNNDKGYEYSMRQLVDRMVRFWTEALCDEKIINDDQKSIVYDEVAFMMLNQMWAPNSPQWFNTGLNLAYGLTGDPQGHYYFDEEKGEVVASKDAYTRTQGSACFIVSVDDKLIGEHSLTDQMTTETLLFKYGSGVGTNWSNIRSVDEPLSGGGKSSGLLSFLKVFDRNAGAIKSGGTTRRAAKMNILDIDHPEILEYIKWKADEEEKVLALGKMGYSVHFEGEAYETVSGQNANNSVRIKNDFMESIGDDHANIRCTGRVSNKADKEISASAVWNEIAKAAWRCGDPGVQFDDVINSWHTCPAGEDGVHGAKYNRINASNPCSEYMFLDDTACNLASINIVKFYDSEKESFNLEAYMHTIKMGQLVLEATIHWGQFPTKDIARKSYKFRTTGLGLTNLGMLFMLMAVPYDSEEARNIASSLMSMLTGYSYYTSALLAEKTSPFSSYKLNESYMKKVINNHAAAACSLKNNRNFIDMPYKPVLIDHLLLNSMGFSSLSDKLIEVWDNAIEAGNKYGFRNAQVSVLAPTGTIAFAMDCATTSSEPFFSHVAYKKLVGGGHMEIVNPAIKTALSKLGYSSDEIDGIVNYVMRKEEKEGYTNIIDGKIEGAPFLQDRHLAVFDTANRCGTGKRAIEPDGHVKMMGALSPHVTGAISKTVNMLNDATVEDVKSIYELSWKMGVKAIALYRDGCKASQPLNTAFSFSAVRPLEDYTYFELLEYIKASGQSQKPTRIKPKGIRTARVHEAQIDGLKLYITTSFYEDGRLGEIYVSSGRQGSLVKGLLDSISTTLSEMLQYGVPPEDIARMYRGQKYEPSGFVSGHPYIKSIDSISDLISKIIDIELGNYTYCQVKPDERFETFSPKTVVRSSETETKSHFNTSNIIQGEVCPTCKSSKLVKNGTCKVCADCGTTTGCS